MTLIKNAPGIREESPIPGDNHTNWDVGTPRKKSKDLWSDKTVWREYVPDCVGICGKCI